MKLVLPAVPADMLALDPMAGLAPRTLTGPLTAFDPHEHGLVERALAAVAKASPADAAILRGLVIELRASAVLLERQRNLREPTQLGGEPRDERTLINHLCSIDGLSGDLALPLKATLSRTFLLTKINFLRGFVKSTAALHQVADCVHICRELREQLAQSIYTLLAEELFLALLRKRDVAAPTKSKAADLLISIWDDATLEIDDFAPLLEAAWHARNRVNTQFGTLLGASETCKLVAQDCPEEVVDFFGRDDLTSDEAAAFEEFLFNMTYEELVKLREAMRVHGLRSTTPQWAATVLGRDVEALEHSAEIDPMALYRSYQRRQLATDFRIMAGQPGPRRTAEAYLMVHLLEQP